MEFVYSDAREMFNATREAAREYEAAINYLDNADNVKGLDTSREKITGGGLVSGGLLGVEWRERMQQRANDAKEVIDFALLVLYGRDGGGIASLLTPIHADVCALHYVGRVTWREVADKSCLSERTARRYADAACDMIDARGFQNTIEGRGAAEL